MDTILLDKKLLSALDVLRVTDRDAVVLISLTANICGINLEEEVISRSTIRNYRIKFRKEFSEEMLNKQLDALTIHWDGKQLQDITGKNIVERLPIIISSGKNETLLGVPKLSRGTGETVSNEVFITLKKYKVEDTIIAMSYDTTAVNTGIHNGACILLENKLNRDLLHLSCKHHILELLLEAEMSNTLVEKSIGPDIVFFKNFQNNWDLIDTKKFNNGLSDRTFKSLVSNDMNEVIIFVKKLLSLKNHPRDDYKELLNLTLLCLGGCDKIFFCVPGPIHKARWMARAIYILKMFLFRKQLDLDKEVLNNLSKMAAFICVIYVPAWFRCLSPVSSPKNDLELLQKLHKYSSRRTKIGSFALDKLLNHLWYLSEELICLSLFDKTIDSKTKEAIVKKFNGPIIGIRNVKAEITNRRKISALKLHDFATPKSLNFFNILGVKPSFLSINVNEWEKNDEFLMCQDMCKKLRVVNDTAERGVALIINYNKILTNDEEQKQFLLQLVSQKRKQFSRKKKDLILLANQE